MKKKSASQSAFFNLRILTALFIGSVGLFLALAGSGALSPDGFHTVVQTVGKNKIIVSSDDPLVPAGFDCSKIRQERIDRQENMRAQALMIACDEGERGSSFKSIYFRQVCSEYQKRVCPAGVRFGRRRSGDRHRDLAQHYSVGDVQCG